MAATERRNGISRRGMTVLGKVPIVPKPINLPSQRSTFCWGGGRKFSNGVLSGKFASALVDPVSSDENLESKLVTSTATRKLGDGLDGREKKNQSSGVNMASTTNNGSNIAKKIEETRNAVTHVENRKREMPGLSLQKGGDIRTTEAFVPPGFTESIPCNHSKPSVVSTESQGDGVSSNVQRETQPGSQNRSGAKDREIIVIHMVGGPGFCGNFPPQFGFAEGYNRNGGGYGNVPLQFGNFEPFFGLQSHALPPLPTATGGEYYDEREDYICYEKECFKGACHDVGRHRDGWIHGSVRNNSFVSGVQGEVCDSLISGAANPLRARSFPHRHLSRNAGRSRSFYRNGGVMSTEEANCEPFSEKRITLLTKVSQSGVELKNSLKETGNEMDSEFLAGHVSGYLNAQFYDDEGKPPIEDLEDMKVSDANVKTGLSDGISINLEIRDGEMPPKETKAEILEVSSSKITCNDKCLHCKSIAGSGGSPTSLCLSCEKTTVCESSFSNSKRRLELTEPVPVSIPETDSSTDGCKADVKHIILDAHEHSKTAVKNEASSKRHESGKESDEGSPVLQNSNGEVVKMSADSLVETLLTNCERGRQKLVYVKKAQLNVHNKPGIRMSKARFKTKKFGLQGAKLSSVTNSTSSSDPEESLDVEAAKPQQEDEGKSASLPSCPLNLSKGFKMGTVAVALVNKKNERQQKVVYRRVSEQATDGLPLSKSKFNTGPLESISTELQEQQVSVEDVGRSTPSVPGYEYHIIRRRVYHVVEGSEERLYPPTPSSSRDDYSKKHMGDAEVKNTQTIASSSKHSVSESVLLQESAVETTSCGSFTQDKSDTFFCSVQSSSDNSLSSRQNSNVTKRNEKIGRQLSAWRPKSERQATDSGKAFIKKREKGANSSMSALVGACKGQVGLPDVGPIDDFYPLNKVKTVEENSLESIQSDLCLEPSNSSHEASQCGEINELSNHTVEPHTTEELFENMAFLFAEEGDGNDSMKQAEDVSMESPLTSDSKDNISVKEVQETTDQPIIGQSIKPFIKKKQMSYEEANRYHQMMIRRYKEIGQWKPKANTNKKSIKSKENVRPNQDDKAPG